MSERIKHLSFNFLKKKIHVNKTNNSDIRGKL